MSNSGDRFYLMEFRNRPALYGDIGSNLRISGLFISGGGTGAVLTLPGHKMGVPKSFELTLEEWSDFIRRSDNPEILVGEPKIFQRKTRYDISGAVQQRIWAADGFKCMYCGVPFGVRLMTIDHFIPLELGGANDDKNYLSACKNCNKDKGPQHPRDWCKLDYDNLTEYLEVRRI